MMRRPDPKKGALVLLAGLLAITTFAHYRTSAKLDAVCEYVGQHARRAPEFAGYLAPGDRAALMQDLEQAERELERQTGQKVDLRHAKAERALAICGEEP